jgi:hypothetical protein
MVVSHVMSELCGQVQWFWLAPMIISTKSFLLLSKWHCHLLQSKIWFLFAIYEGINIEQDLEKNKR